MKNRLYSLCGKIVSPITANPIYFSSLCIILFFPAFIYCLNSNDWKYLVLAIVLNSILAYLLCLLYQFFNKSKAVSNLTFFVVGILCVVEGYTAYMFGTLFSATTLQMILETNPNEASGFFISYCLTSKSLIYYLIVSGLTLLLFYANRHLKSWRISVRSNTLLCLFACLIGVSVVIYISRDIRAIPVRCLSDKQVMLEKLSRLKFSANYTPFGRLYYSFHLYYYQADEINQLSKILSQDHTVSRTYTIENVVVVLGESFNKYHSSLYGYPHATNPQLEEEKLNNNLYLFGDVVAPYNYTHHCLKKILSFASQDQTLQWYEAPLFPALFKSAGYESLFISNQEVKGQDVWAFDFVNNYLVSSKIAPFLFNKTNETKQQFDLGLVHSATEWLNRHPQLWIYHLLGQHSNYMDRYPVNEQVFSIASYADRTDLSDAQKRGVAHYDNATLYNDKVVATILEQFRDQDAIVIYLSDHGEEVYDYRDHMGRSHEPIITPERAKYQFEVPFMIWMSDKYKENHPDVVAQVERSIDRPYMIDDLPHLMLDLAGIECEWFDPTRSVINDKFNTKRKRLLLDSKQDYDEIMKGAK